MSFDSIDALSKGLRDKEFSSEELTNRYLARIEEVEERVGSFVTLTAESALDAAKEADRRLASGKDVTPLTGIPVSVKDIFCTTGVATTCASKILENFIPPYDSTVVRKLKEAGAIILGKVNMDEFAMGSSTENSAFKITHNPWDLGHVPGGSSGGSAASVAAKQCVASVGTDTGGSIRQPASCCGVVGLKPTYGRISRYGMIAFASSLDQAGPLTTTIADAAHMLGVVAGHDPRDSTCIDAPVPDYAASLGLGVKGLRIGIPKEYFIEGIEPEVEASIRAAIDVYKSLGAQCVEITLPHTEYGVSAYYLVATAEASSNLARFDGVKYGLRVDEGQGLHEMYKNTRSQGFGPEVKRRIMLGTYALSAGYYDAYYNKASKARTLIKGDFDKAFADCDVILTPTAPTPAFKLGEKTTDPLAMYLSDVFTLASSLAGLPGISLPCGFTTDGLPIGLQLIGKTLDEETVLRTAAAFEGATDWHKKSPEL